MNVETFSPSYYKNKIKELNQRFYLVLDEIRKSYPRYKVFSNNPEYENIYSNDISNMEKINKDFFLLKKSLEKDSVIMNKLIYKKDAQIKLKQKQNEELKGTLQDLITGNNSSIGMIEQKEQAYNHEILNLTMGLVSVLGIMIYIYRK